MSLSTLFHASSLRIHVPPEPISPPPADATQQTRTAWVTNVLAVESRKLAFYDEQLGMYASVRLSDASIDDDRPSEEVIAFLSQLQITLESTYISALPPSPSPHQSATFPFPPTPGLVPSTPTGNGLSPPRIRTSSPSPSGGGRLSPGPSPSTRNFPPSTPNPTPSMGSSEERRYARAEGVPVWSATWSSTPKKRKEVILAKVSGDRTGWVAVWELEAPVAFLRTRIDNPLLCLTVSMTLRDKPTRGIIAGFDLPVEKPAIAPAPKVNRDHVSATDLEDVNLLDDFGTDLSFPFSRLRPVVHASPTSAGPMHQGPRIIPPVDLIGLPTLRKSYRSILSVASGLHLRMRTVFLPQLLLDHLKGGRPAADEDDGLDDDDEDRKVVMSVEVEATGGGADGMSGERIGFEIESVEVKVGGAATGAQAELLEEPRPSEGNEAGFPLSLHSLDQYNLLYAVSASVSAHYNPSANPLPPPTPMSTITAASYPSTAQQHQQQGRNVSQQYPAAPPSGQSESIRPVSISVVGRPFVDHDGIKEYPTASFVSRWNCTLDLSHLEATSDKRISLPTVAGVVPNSSSGSASRPASMVAGNKRFSAASLSAFSANSPHLTHGGFTSSASNQLPNGLQPPPAQASSSYNHNPPPTPAFPSYQGQPPVLPPSQLAFAHQSGPSRPTSAMDARRRTTQVANPPPTPAPGRPLSGAGMGWDQGQVSMTTASQEADGVLISISVLVPEGGKRPIRVLEPFSLEVFVFNKSTRTRRFSIGVPEKRRRRDPLLAMDRNASNREDVGIGEARLHAHLVEHLASSTPLIPLENHILVGPLLPRTSQSVRMRFMALEAGVHEIETLTVSGVGEGFAINLKSVCNVVVKGGAE